MTASLPYPETGLNALRRKPTEDNLNSADVRVVRTLEDLQKAWALRAAVFLAEQECPYAEEYDGNDLVAMHLLLEKQGEPVGTLRLRWFAGFGKVERVCVLPHARGAHAERVLLAHAFEIAARKGYRMMIGQIQARLWPLWSRTLHCHLRSDRPAFSFSGYDYLEIDIPLPAYTDALSPRSDPFVLIRPEGHWGQPGVLETQLKRDRLDLDAA